MKAFSLSEIKRVYNNCNEGFNALMSIEENVGSWSSVLLFNVEKKLENNTAELWFREKGSIENATFQRLLEFMEKKISELESISKNGGIEKAQQRFQFRTHAAVSQVCPMCPQKHLLYECDKFKYASIEEKRAVVRQNNICFNCLHPSHRAIDCKRAACKKCGKKHNTLLHMEMVKTNMNNTSSGQPSISSINVLEKHQSAYVVLPTAIVMIQDCRGLFQACRALLDSGSQCTLISESCAQRLGLKRTYDKTRFFGIGSGSCNYTKGKVDIRLHGQDATKIMSTVAFCVSRLTQNLPHQEIHDANMKFFRHLELADPSYDKPGKIDLLLGADMFSECILQGKVQHPEGSPTLLNTVFGWVVMGQTTNVQNNQQLLSGHVTMNLDQHLQRFWEVEELVSQEPKWTTEEQQAELHYQTHTSRNHKGRYVVKLPFKNDELIIGETKSQALKRLYAMESRCKNNDELGSQYNAFMTEYLTLGHMQRSSNTDAESCVLPHHAVVKPSSTTTKLRVVFDASCKSSNGYSLNDNMLVGPTVQSELIEIIIRFRKYEIAMTGDIEKMYRQILVHPEDRPKQRILWRRSRDEEVAEFDLVTVTYGTASAPFLATRTLKQIAIDNAESHPTATKHITGNFYVDDFVCSIGNTSSAIALRNEMSLLLQQSGLHLRKWASNSIELLRTISHEDKETNIDGHQISVLGMNWDAATDSLSYKATTANDAKECCTKREILSAIAKCYDPLGWMSPVIVRLKIFMQRLWLTNVNWDEELTLELRRQWSQYKASINDIVEVSVPRWIQDNNDTQAELHGFSDASELAYAAVVYVRIKHESGTYMANIVAAKTRVAPVNQLSLPRLELCGAQLLSKLMVKIKSAPDIEDLAMYAWTDSTIVLAWLAEHPRKWKSFIANRTSQIISVLPSKQWRHIPSKQNPADLATRGMSSLELKNAKLWWHGPNLLREQIINSSVVETPMNVDMEERKIVLLNVTPQHTDIFTLYSNFTKLIRITSYLLRFKSNSLKPTGRVAGCLTTVELENALDVLIKQAQHEHFEFKIRLLTKNEQLPLKKQADKFGSIH